LPEPTNRSPRRDQRDLKELAEFLFSGAGRSCLDGKALYAYEIEIFNRLATYLEAKFYCLAHPGHEFVQRLRLRVAAAQRGNRGDEIALGVMLDNDVELAGHMNVLRGHFTPSSALASGFASLAR